jgi:hypothetical protein
MSHAKSHDPLQARAIKPTPPPWVRPPQVAHTRLAIHLTQRNFSVKLSSQRRRKPLILASLRGGLASYTASLLYLGLRYLKLQTNRVTPPPNSCRRNHRTIRTASRPSTPKSPQHHPANTGQTHVQPPRANNCSHHHCQTKACLDMRRLLRMEYPGIPASHGEPGSPGTRHELGLLNQRTYHGLLGSGPQLVR